MISIIIFLIAVGILLLEGWLLARFFIPAPDKILRVTFALPLVAISNVLLFLIFTICKIPLVPLTLLMGHGILIAITAFLAGRMDSASSPRAPAPELIKQRATSNEPTSNIIRTICILLLANVFAFSFIHAVILPTFSIDSFTNWTMRSKISFEDHAIAFDRDETRGMAKPQYPFLTHALQIAANQGQPAWSDHAANAVTWLLSLSCFTALFLLLRRLRGIDTALIAVTLIAGVPLLSIHLAQGYGDIHLAGYLLLALMTYALWVGQKQSSSLILSALFIAGAMWTKSEGLFFGFAPWALLVLWQGMEGKKGIEAIEEKKASLHSLHALQSPLLAIAGAFFLFLPFPLLLIAKDLPLTPHGTDMSFAWHPEGLTALLPSLFGGGSFGIIWYVLPVATLALIIALRRKSPKVDGQFSPMLLWGWLVVAENLFIYLCTPNVTFLLDGQSFFRQLLPAAALLILACTLLINPLRSSSSHS